MCVTKHFPSKPSDNELVCYIYLIMLYNLQPTSEAAQAYF